RSLARELADDAALRARLRNDLEAPAVRLCPAIARLRGQLHRAGARAVGMSGSGATVYGVFADRAAAARAAAGFALPGRGGAWGAAPGESRYAPPLGGAAPRRRRGAPHSGDCWGVAKLVRQRPLEPPSAGSSPAAPAPFLRSSPTADEAPSMNLLKLFTGNA